MTMKQLAMVVLVQIVARGAIWKRSVCAGAVACSECI